MGVLWWFLLWCCNYDDCCWVRCCGLVPIWNVSLHHHETTTLTRPGDAICWLRLDWEMDQGLERWTILPFILDNFFQNLFRNKTFFCTSDSADSSTGNLEVLWRGILTRFLDRVFSSGNLEVHRQGIWKFMENLKIPRQEFWKFFNRYSGST